LRFAWSLRFTGIHQRSDLNFPVYFSNVTIQHRSWYVHLGTIVLGTLAVLSVALANGFPLVYSDTGTYLRSAFTGFVPEDRPYWYGLFIQVTSLNGATLWGVVIVQAALCSALLWRCWSAFGDGRAWTFLLSIGILAPCTGLGWYAGQLVADIFSVIGLLAGLLFMLAPSRLLERVFCAMLIVLACWVHLSNLLILPLVLSVTAIAAWRMKWTVDIARLGSLAVVLIATWPGLMLANKAVDGEAYISRHSHVFLMSRMAESGILQKWLDEHCATEPYTICNYKDSIPTNSRIFMWSDHSPAHWQGGGPLMRTEYKAIINSTLSDPEYLAMHVAASLRSTWQLLGLWRVADELEGEYYRQDYSAPYGSIAGLTPQHLEPYLNSAQNTGRGTLGLRWIDRIYQGLMTLTLLACVALLVSRTSRKLNAPLLIFGVATMIVGAWVCATLSTVDSRFMARTAWLLPFVVMMLVWNTKRPGLTGSE